MNVAKIEKDRFGFKVIDSRNNSVVKDSIKKGSKAAAIAEVYNQEIIKAEKQWENMQ